MVSLPSFLTMATETYSRELRQLQMVKGCISTLTGELHKLIESVGEIPCPDLTRHSEKPKSWGEVLYKLSVIASFINQDLEELTNELRVRDGKYPLDYSDTRSARILKDWHEGIQQMAEEMGVQLSADGRLVRS
jgi:hypothetical protein